MTHASAKQAFPFGLVVTDAESEKAGCHGRSSGKVRNSLVRANAEAEQIHQLVKKLNVAIERAAENGLATSLVVRGSAPASRVTLEVRTTFDLLEVTAAGFGPADND